MPKRDWMPCTSPEQNLRDRFWREFVRSPYNDKQPMRDVLPAHYKQEAKKDGK